MTPPDVHFFAEHELPVSRWRNGGGETREIVCEPDNEGGFSWRASIATIAQDGDFSRFDNIDRHITLLSGAGVTLHFPAFAHRLCRAEPVFFAGETPLRATLHGEESRDFNIMTRRDTHSATVLSVSDALTLNGQAAGVVYVLSGAWQVGDKVCQAGEGIWWNRAIATCKLTPQSDDARLLFAAVFRRT